MPAANALLRARTTNATPRYNGRYAAVATRRRPADPMTPDKADSSTSRRACGEAAPDEAQVAHARHVPVLPLESTNQRRSTAARSSLAAESRYCIVQR